MVIIIPYEADGVDVSNNDLRYERASLSLHRYSDN
jgi:hypothetical protein